MKQSLISIMKTLGSNIDLSIYEHPYKDEILATAPQVFYIFTRKTVFTVFPRYLMFSLLSRAIYRKN